LLLLVARRRCNRLESLALFHGGRRTCTAQLEAHNARRRSATAHGAPHRATCDAPCAAAGTNTAAAAPDDTCGDAPAWQEASACGSDEAASTAAADSDSDAFAAAAALLPPGMVAALLCG
jgi:hypothetical protein